MTESQYIYVDLLHAISLCVWLLQCELAGQKKIIALLNGGAWLSSKCQGVLTYI